LSIPIILGYPIVAYNVGAFTERLENRKYTWLLDSNQTLYNYIEIIKEKFNNKILDNDNTLYKNVYEKKIIENYFFHLFKK
jgi:hypothetical protein